MDDVIAVDVGGSRFRVGLFDADGRRFLVSEDETSRSGGRDWMLEHIGERSKILLNRSDHPVRA